MASRLSVLAAVSGMLIAVSACATRQAPDVTSAAPPATAGDLTAQLAPYVDAQQALAADDFDGARVALEFLLTVADDVTRPLTRIAAAADSIETMRAEFKPLSEFLAAMDLPPGHARAYCPMYDGGSNWVQVDGPVRNPYYGSTMLTCGVVDAAPGAHMDHTPRHGGTVFMAPDSFHHIEGAYPEGGRFRVYASDNYREPVDVSLWMGRAVLEEEYDEVTDEFREVVAFPLLPSPDGAYLEAEVGDLAVPAEITVKLQVVEDFPEDRFDFIFMELSSTARDAAPLSVADAAPVAVPLAERIRPRIPDLTSEIVTGIGGRNKEIGRPGDAGCVHGDFHPLPYRPRNWRWRSTSGRSTCRCGRATTCVSQSGASCALRGYWTGTATWGTNSKSATPTTSSSRRSTRSNASTRRPTRDSVRWAPVDATGRRTCADTAGAWSYWSSVSR